MAKGSFPRVSGVPVTKCTDEVIDKIVNNLRLGLYLESAVILADVQKTTFYTWIKNSHDPEKRGYKKIYAALRVAVEKAMEEATARDLMVIDKAANGQEWEYERDSDGNLVLNGRGNPIVKKIGQAPNWNASAWRLERRRPKEFGARSQVEHTGSVGTSEKEIPLTEAELIEKLKQTDGR